MIVRCASALLLPLALIACSGEQDRVAAPPAIEPAELTVHPVVEAVEGQASEQPVTASGGVARDEDGLLLRLGPAALTGKDVRSAVAGGPGARGVVTVEWTQAAAATWSRLTGTAACQPPGDAARRVAFVVDGLLLSSPQVAPDVQCDVGIVGGAAGLTGAFSPQEAEVLAERLTASATAR